MFALIILLLGVLALGLEVGYLIGRRRGEKAAADRIADADPRSPTARPRHE